MNIPQEWVEKPKWQSNHYCAICQEPMPLICHVCRQDINDQQNAAAAEEAAHAGDEDGEANNDAEHDHAINIDANVAEMPAAELLQAPAMELPAVVPAELPAPLHEAHDAVLRDLLDNAMDVD
jgi:hypothetical protein